MKFPHKKRTRRTPRLATRIIRPVRDRIGCGHVRDIQTNETIAIVHDGPITVSNIETQGDVMTFTYPIPDQEIERHHRMTKRLVAIIESFRVGLECSKRYCVKMGSTGIVFVTPAHPNDTDMRDGGIQARNIVHYWMVSEEELEVDVAAAEANGGSKIRILGVHDSNPDPTASVSYEMFTTGL